MVGMSEAYQKAIAKLYHQLHKDQQAADWVRTTSHRPTLEEMAADPSLEQLWQRMYASMTGQLDSEFEEAYREAEDIVPKEELELLVKEHSTYINHIEATRQHEFGLVKSMAATQEPEGLSLMDYSLLTGGSLGIILLAAYVGHGWDQRRKRRKVRKAMDNLYGTDLSQ